MNNLCIVFYLIVFLFQCSEKEITVTATNETHTDNNKNLSITSDNLLNSFNSFSIDLFSSMAIDTNLQNTFISPYCIFNSLILAYAGAAGSTKEEIAEVLKLNPDDTTIFKKFKNLSDDLGKSNDSDIELNMANALWVKKEIPILDDYLYAAKTYINSTVENLDFSDKVYSVNRINNWVMSHTNNRITNVMNQGDLNNSSCMAITSAIYFKSKWNYEFDEVNTKKDVFYNNGIEKDSALFMNQTNNFKYFENELFQVVEIPYHRHQFSMFIYLPKENDGLLELINEFTLKNWVKWNKELEQCRVKLSIPKFELDKSYDLNNVLKEMGINNAFSSRADFSYLTESMQVQLDKLKHKSFIDVNEKNTEAAASTLVIMSQESSNFVGQELIKQFKADHPFLFTINYNKEELILFIGTYQTN
ncbi:MAG: serpin family protein [Bacteroidales bacterium]|nr:serpin family protein [Bacteroidales bacterium]